MATCSRYWKSQYTMISGQYLNRTRYHHHPQLEFSSHLSTGGNFLLPKSIHYLFCWWILSPKKSRICVDQIHPSGARTWISSFSSRPRDGENVTVVEFLPSSLGQFWVGAVLAIGSVSFLVAPLKTNICPLETFWWAWKMMNFYFWKWSLFRFQATC